MVDANKNDGYLQLLCSQQQIRIFGKDSIERSREKYREVIIGIINFELPDFCLFDSLGASGKEFRFLKLRLALDDLAIGRNQTCGDFFSAIAPDDDVELIQSAGDFKEERTTAAEEL